MFKSKLYCITCDMKDTSPEEQIELACAGGADAIQFRAKNFCAKDIMRISIRIKEICAGFKVPFILNDRADIALAIDCDGVHLGQNDLPVEWARQVLGGIKIVGRSVSTLGQATAAAKEGADYILLGPIYSHPDKPEQEINSIDLVRMVRERVKLPVLATGGVNVRNVREVLEAGADGIAVTRAVCGTKDIREAAASLKAKLEETAVTKR